MNLFPGIETKSGARHSTTDHAIIRSAREKAQSIMEDMDALGYELKAIPEIAEDAHPGAMICLVVPDEVRESLEEYGDEPDHLTLCYLGGDADALEENKADIIESLSRIARMGEPVEGFLGGVARFNASESTEGRDVLVALVDSPDLPCLHGALCEALEDCGVDLPTDHGFMPHITLEYIETDARTPNIQIPRTPVTFDALTLVWAGERIDIPFGSEDEEDDTPMGMYAAKDWSELPPAELIDDAIALAPIGEIKSWNDTRLIIQGVRWGTEDLTGDSFEPSTDLGFSRSPIGMPVYYDHAQRGIKSQIGLVTSYKANDDGIDFEVELDRHNRYVETVKQLYARRILGGSTGAASHLVIRQDGRLKRWIIAELSLTPTPAEPRTVPSLNTKSAETPETPAETAETVDGGSALSGLVIKAITDTNTLRLARRYARTHQ